MKNKALKLTLATALGIFVGVTLFDALPRKKTVDDYVNCFNREAEMYKLPDNEKEMANNPVWDFHVVFDLRNISVEEAEEFMQKSGRTFSGGINGNDKESLNYKVDVQTYEKAEKLERGLFKCLGESIKSTGFGYSDTKTLE